MVRGPRDENVLSTGVCSPFRQCNVNQRRRIPRRSCICPYTPYYHVGEGINDNQISTKRQETTVTIPARPNPSCIFPLQWDWSGIGLFAFSTNT